MKNMRFDGKVVLITGGGRGLGRDYALLFAKLGAQVVVNDLGNAPDGAPLAETPADRVVAEITAAGGTAIADRNSVIDGAAVVATAMGRFGRLDVVVNNAGITGGGLFADIDPAAWDRLVGVHIGGTVAITRAAWPHLVAAGHGRVINMASTAAFGGAYTSHYSMAKSAMIGLTRSLGTEGAPHGLTVNAVMPTAFTRLTAQIPNDALRTYLEAHYDPADVAPFVTWLAHEATQISGEIFSVGGGRAARVVLSEARGAQVRERTPEAWADVADLVMAMDGAYVPANMTDELYWKMGLFNPEGQALAERLRDAARSGNTAF